MNLFSLTFYMSEPPDCLCHYIFMCAATLLHCSVISPSESHFSIRLFSLHYLYFNVLFYQTDHYHYNIMSNYRNHNLAIKWLSPLPLFRHFQALDECIPNRLDFLTYTNYKQRAKKTRT